ncbi:hypothetical protein MTBBW1_1960003 [Desulfamplus magnetovallimortis]|uniref:Uncharacterized protein n=1 Tax=Desulfamplus magnetovallimortis TaxID=1246637 RepID=A0A1W1HBA3_9BACT|nr:hypothetical protein MTBBW1_1960003 [Desulfamplus magnetovallimortis]
MNILVILIQTNAINAEKTSKMSLLSTLRNYFTLSWFKNSEVNVNGVLIW